MSFRIYDSRSKQIHDFAPLRDGEASIYHCGLTVYGSPHLGHLRKEVVFDVLRRWLTHLGYKVKIVANVTDIDDKILRSSKAQGNDWYSHAYHFERELHDAYAALGCLPPTYEPRATGHIPEMIELMATLIEKGHAYAAEDGSGDVYFDVRSWPEYGSLSNQCVDDMQDADDAPARGKKSPLDFALWKGKKDDEPETASWDTPWGRGRPGWHLECSAMAGKYLGDEFDIHGGGIDLRFPHHENELAQSAAAGRGFAKYWMHNAWVTASGEKMSKSLGNGATVAEVTEKYPPRAVRLFLVAPHYRSAVELSHDLLAESATALQRIDNFVDRATSIVGGDVAIDHPLPEAFVAAMNEDLSTPQAVAVIYERVRQGNIALEANNVEDITSALADVVAMLRVLGLDANAPEWKQTGGSDLRPIVDELVSALLEQRTQARARKDYAASDAIRDQLSQIGINVEDTPQGPRWTVGG